MPLKDNVLKDLSPEELKTKYGTLTAELYDLRQHARIGKLEKPAKIWKVRKDIARVLTVLRQKDIKI